MDQFLDVFLEIRKFDEVEK